MLEVSKLYRLLADIGNRFVPEVITEYSLDVANDC